MKQGNLSSRASPLRLAWFVTALATAALVLGGFWVLLGHRFSPDTYHSAKIPPSSVELAWFGLMAVGAIMAAVSWWSKQVLCVRAVRALWPMAVVAAAVLALGLREQPVPCWAVILFSAACGWSVRRWAQTEAEQLATPPNETALKFWRGALLAAAVGLGVYFVAQQIDYLNNLALGYWDCGEEARVVHNTWHNPRELFLRMNPDKPLYWDHFEAGAIPFVILGGLGPPMGVLIVYQVIATLLGALPLYWIGKRLFADERAALLLAVSWLVYPSVSQFIYNASYGFRWGSFCLPLYFFALAFWLQGRGGCALAAAVWAVLIKEEAAIPIGMFGVYLALIHGQRRKGWMLAAACFAYFLLIAGWVVPTLAGAARGYTVQNYFSDLGASKSEILLAPLLRPSVFWGRLLEGPTFYFAATLLAPLLLLPFKKLSALLIGSLTFLFVCLWYNPLVKSICYQYQAGLLPVLFFALALAVRDESAALRRATLLGVAVAGLTLSVFFGNTFWSKESIVVRPARGRLALLQRFAAQIEPDKSLLCTHRAASHFIHQKYLYLTGRIPPAVRPDYALLDMRDSWRPAADLEWLRSLLATQRQIAAQGELHLVGAQDGLLLYARKGTPLDARTLVERDALPPSAVKLDIPVSQTLHVVAYTASADSSPRRGAPARLFLTIFSSVSAPLTDELAARCILVIETAAGEREFYASDMQALGQSVWPTPQWQSSKFYADEFAVELPAELLNRPFALSVEAMPLSLAQNPAPPASR